MAWIHCMNCGWQGDVPTGKFETIGGMAGLLAGVALGVAVSWVAGGIAIVLSIIGIVMGAGAKATACCKQCQSTDIKFVKHDPARTK